MIPGGVQIQHVIFSLKTFAAGMLAYYIALRFGMENPYWALGTVYIVSNPVAGAITSKAFYRLGGTALGAIMLVILVPNLVQVPALLSVAITLWVALCLFISMMDRTPRSYVFMLGGYTVALTGFLLVSDPTTSFTYAVGRIEEIGLGIICAALIGRVVLPQHMGPAVSGRVDGWLGNAASLARDTLTGTADAEAIRAERNKLAADATALRVMTTHVGFEGAEGRALSERMQALQYRMVMVLPQLSELGDLRLSLTHSPQAMVRGDTLMAEVTGWLDLDASEALAETDALLARIIAMRATLEEETPAWDNALLRRLAQRLEDFVTVWADCLLLRSDLATGETHKLRRSFSARYRHQFSLHTDYGTALLAVLSVIISGFVGCALWIYTGWSYGGNMVMMSLILCSFMATMDNSVPVIKKVLQLTLIAVGTACVYQYAILPAVDDFASLAAGLGLLLIPCGVLLGTPTGFLFGFQVSVNVIYMLMLSNQAPTTDFPTFFNACLGTVAGLALAAAVTALVRAIGAERAAARILHSGWKVVADAAHGIRPIERDLIVERMLDRLGQIVPRMGALPTHSAVHGNDILRDLRIGLNVLRIQQEKAKLPPADRQAAETALQAVAAFYDARRKAAPGDHAPLVAALDQGLRQMMHGATPPQGLVRDALVGLRAALCPAEDPPQLTLPQERIPA